jgi:hypothetical protein
VNGRIPDLIVDRIKDIEVTLVILKHHPGPIGLGEEPCDRALLVAELIHR